MQEQPYYVGLDLGGTKILSICFDSDLNQVGSDYRATEAEGGPEHVIDRMVESAQAAAGGRPIAAVGVSTPGPSRPKEGIVTTPPNLPGWRDVPLAELISNRLGTPAWIENDANAAALAEYRLGAGRGTSHMILIAAGTGIGGGIVVDGRLVHGASGAAGELGHQLIRPGGPVCGCGRRGCLEAVASGIALNRVAHEMAEAEPQGTVARIAAEEGEEPDARVLELAMRDGDAEAEAAIRQAGRDLGEALANLVNVLNPELIVVGGSLRKIGDPYLGEAIRVMERDAFDQAVQDVRVVEAELGDEAPAIGAAILAIERHRSLQAS